MPRLAERPRPTPRRRSLDLACLNGLLWGVGDGLASVSLVNYLAREYHASYTAFAWITALPSLAALVRLAAPAWMTRSASRRRFTVGTFAASATTLAAMAVFSAPHVLPEEWESLILLAVGWGAFNALEQVAAVALWEWLGDLAPALIRGRFVGRREAFINAGRALGGGATAMFTWYWLRRCQELGDQDHEYVAYSACVVVASLFFIAAIWPLLGMTPTPQRRRNEPPPVRATLRDLAAPLIDVRYRQLLGFGVLFSLANGIFISVRRPLEMGALSLYEKKVLDAGSRGAQSLLTPQLGRLADRRGNRLLLVWSQLVIALAPLAVLAVRINGGEVDPTTRGWILAAYVCWLAYAAQNVAQPNLMLNLAPRDRRASYIAVWFAVNQFALALGVFVGARLLSWQTVRGAENSANLLPLLLGSSAIICAAAWQASRIPESNPAHKKVRAGEGNRTLA